MKKNYQVLSAGIALLLMITCAPGLVLAKEHLLPGTLKAKEVSNQFFNRTVEAETEDGKRKLLFYFSPNGELRRISQSILEKGHWKVRKNGRLCTKIRNKKWSCRAIVKSGDVFIQYIVKKDANHLHELTYNSFHSGKKLKELNRFPILPAGTLSNKKIKLLFEHQTVESVTATKGRVSQTYYSPDGKVEQLRDGVKRTGTWRVKKNRICLQMDSLREKCRIIVKEGDTYKKYIVKKNGRHQHSVSYRKFTTGKHL